MPTFTGFLSVCAAGAAGTGVRYLIATWSAEKFGPGFPYGTLTVNLVGCFLIAIVMQMAAAQGWAPSVRATIAVGFLGGFTTYSSFNFETMAMMQTAPATASAYLVSTLVGGFIAGWIGLAAGRLFAA